MDFKAGIYDATGAGIIGSTNLKLKIKRDSDDQFYDFNDNTFKGSGHITIAATMTDIDITNVPGEYEYSVDVSNWDDGVYTCYFQYLGTPPFTNCSEFWIYNGQEATPSVFDLSQDMLDAIRDSVTSKNIDGSIDLKECLKVILAVLAGNISRSGNTYTFRDQSNIVKLTQMVTPNAVTRTIE